MTKFFRFGAAGVAMAAALAAAPAMAQTNSDTADARAEILSALTLTVQAGSALDFGAVVIQNSAVAGTLSMGSDGVLDCSDANLICSGTTDVPVFDVTGGSADKWVTINLPTSTYLYLGGTPTVDETQRLTLDNFTSDGTFTAASTDPVLDAYGNPVLDGLGNPVTVTTPAYYSTQLDSSGEGSFTVGGDLQFDGSEVPGSYEGTFDVSVDYL